MADRPHGHDGPATVLPGFGEPDEFDGCDLVNDPASGATTVLATSERCGGNLTGHGMNSTG